MVNLTYEEFHYYKYYHKRNMRIPNKIIEVIGQSVLFKKIHNISSMLDHRLKKNTFLNCRYRILTKNWISS